MFCFNRVEIVRRYICSCYCVGIWTCKFSFGALVSFCGSRCLLQFIRCVVLVLSLLLLLAFMISSLNSGIPILLGGIVL